MTKRFVGDLSREDAELIELYATRARRVLEFGVGGSTQIIAQSIPSDAVFVALDTDPAYIELERERLGRLGVRERCRMLPYAGWKERVVLVSTSFDLIFDDGVDELRREFALESWPLLEPGGFMLFHDTRRATDFENALGVAREFFEEVEDIYVNQRVGLAASNVTVLKKKARDPYVNWQHVEGKPAWAYGAGQVPEEFWRGDPAEGVEPAWQPPESIPVYVLSFNQPTYLRNMIRQLRKLAVEPREIHVVDNVSTLPALRDYLLELEIQGYQIHRMPRNFGPHAVFERAAGLDLPRVFAVTDPDLEFHPDMPRTFRVDLAETAWRSGTWKCGCALTLHDAERFVPGAYANGLTIREWESAFWTDAVGTTGPVDPEMPEEAKRDPVYRAPVDTTFAVYLRDRRPADFYQAVRVAGRYEARHLPWYAASYALPSAASALRGEPVRLDDGRVLVRPAPCDLAHFRRSASGSTTAALLPETEPGVYLEVTQPNDESVFAVAPWTPHAGWWREHFVSGWRASTFRALRAELGSKRGPTRLVDVGASIGGVALWSALRSEHVYCVEPDPAKVRELFENIAINRFEHCMTVIPNALAEIDDASVRFGDFEALGIRLDTLCRRHGVPLESGNLVVHCNVGGREEFLLYDLLHFVATNRRVFGALFVTLHAPRWMRPASPAAALERAYAEHTELRELRTRSADLDPLDGLSGILSYLERSPFGSVLWSTEA